MCRACLAGQTISAGFYIVNNKQPFRFFEAAAVLKYKKYKQFCLVLTVKINCSIINTTITNLTNQKSLFVILFFTKGEHLNEKK